MDRLTNLKPDGTLLRSAFVKSADFAKCNYMYAAEVIFEIKSTEGQDPYIDATKGNKDFESDKDVARKARGQIIDYATEVQRLQHRTALFTVSLFGHQARISRWDRAGTIVSETFDYVKTQWLAEFLWRYSHAGLGDRGYDENVSIASSDDSQTFVQEVSRYLKRFSDEDHRKKMKNTLDPEYPTYKILVTDEATHKSSAYIVRRPFFDVLSPTGRATRGYLAWGIEENGLRFLKDTWRTDIPGVLSEAEVYDILTELNAPHLPVTQKSGDVKDSNGEVQSTLTDEWATRKTPWSRRTVWIRRHLHHRLVQELALPLHMVETSLQLAKAILNVLIGQYTAFLSLHIHSMCFAVIELAFRGGQLLHRDISAGNVMLNDKLEGILNDWDHVIKLPLAQGCHPYRTVGNCCYFARSIDPQF